MRQFVLRSVAALALVGGAAEAAELPPWVRPAPAGPPVYEYQPPVVVADYTWTGCYAGGYAGGVWARSDWFDEILFDPLVGTDLGSFSYSGAIGGGQVGCNLQIGNWVGGVQGDYARSNAAGTAAADTVVIPTPDGIVTNQSSLRSLSSLTLRIGRTWGWDRFLGYIKGGYAWHQSNHALIVGGFTTATASEMRGGGTAGIGAEYAFLDWLTGFAEYDYYFFGETRNELACVTCGLFAGFPISSLPFNIRTTANVIKVGFNVKIGPTARW